MVRGFFAFLVVSLLLTKVAFSGPMVLDRLDASVNSALILQSDVKKFRKTMKLRGQLDPLFGGTSLSSKGASASDAEIVTFLIDEKLITQQFPISDSEVEQEINSIQSNNKIDRSTLKSALAGQGFDFSDYFEMIRTSASKRNLIDRDIRTKVSISDDDVKNYFFNNYAKSSKTPVAYHLQLIRISPSNYKNPSAAKDAAHRALKDLKSGDTFTEVAKRFSDDSSSVDLGVVTEDQMSPLIREQVKKLKISQVSDVFGNSNAGFFIMKLMDIKTADSDRLDKMREEIRNHLVTAEYQHQIALWIERQRQTAFVHKAGEPSVSNLPTAPGSSSQ